MRFSAAKRARRWTFKEVDDANTDGIRGAVGRHRWLPRIAIVSGYNKRANTGNHEQ